MIDASGASGATAGNVTIQAITRPIAVSMPIVDFYVLEARVEISGATIRAGDVSIRSEAHAYAPAADGWASGLTYDLQNLAQSIPGMVLSMLTGLSMAVSVRQVSAAIELSDTDIISTGSVNVVSDAQTRADTYAIASSIVKTRNPLLLAAPTLGPKRPR